MIFDNEPIPSPQGVKKFYLLDYFFILLQSLEFSEDYDAVFTNFKNLKGKERLGESKYLKLTVDEDLSMHQERRYKYTFEQVIAEAMSYDLLKQYHGKFIISEKGRNCLDIGKKNKNSFYHEILKNMESKYFGFYHLVNFCYNENKSKNGLLIFPVYSPAKLGFVKSEMKKNSDWHDFSVRLKEKLESDIEVFLEKKINLDLPHQRLLHKLDEDQILLRDKEKQFFQKNYNALIGRFRRFWLNYFLNDIYKYPYSFDTFNIWVERGKQFGIIHTTEIYPDFDGRFVFPTSIIAEKVINKDFSNLYKYENKLSLYAHKPIWQNDQTQEDFMSTLINVYYDIRKTRRTHFIRLSDIRERICYRMRIANYTFNEFMEKTYNMNLQQKTNKIRISLEADRLPHESNALYLKKEPILVNGQYKNIIAIDYKKS